MSYTYTSTNRFFIQNPYNLEPDTNPVSFNSQQLLDHLNSIDPQEFDIDGNIIIAEYTIDGKYDYSVIAFSQHIFTPTGKIKKQFKKTLENKSYTDDYTPTNLYENTYENWYN